MKIAYILKMYPRFSETFIVNEILELERRGADVRIYSLRKPDDGRFHAKLAQVKASVIYVPQYPQYEVDRIAQAHQLVQAAYPDAYATVYDDTLKRGHDFAIKRFLQAGYVASHLLKQPVDAMHAHFATSATRVANLVGRMIGVPYSVTAHAKDIFHEDVAVESLRKKLGGARFVVTVSNYNRLYLTQLLGRDSAEIRTLYNGVDRKRFRPPHAPRQLNLILGVGRLVEKKGFAILVDACAILRDNGIQFTCKIVGKGPLQATLQNQIDTLNLSDCVKLVGAQPQDGVLRLMRQSTLFALPCVVGKDGNRDGLPTVLLEAMATGLPAVTTTVTGNPEIVDHERNGLLVPPNDAVALAASLQQLLEDTEKRTEFGLAASKKVDVAFDIRTNVGKLYEWLSEPTAPMFEPDTHESEPLPLPILPSLTMSDALRHLPKQPKKAQLS